MGVRTFDESDMTAIRLRVREAFRLLHGCEPDIDGTFAMTEEPLLFACIVEHMEVGAPTSDAIK